ncbi:30S ribosomal protein S21 [Microvenator marinus]|uniref:Small ribosomal subunit protein bS21 n=1 Tax=Microvenator marinus TaxID=2600177 RepID=A0A5B8XQW8_9DELT|nr:30S ribosomal protein S21 [Microvenator marinus]QED27935.1 30S ribosomal protein S21 [Microvenator marinus]
MAERRKSKQDELGPVEVPVIDNNVGRAINQLKRVIGREGLNRELKRRRFYEKPSVAKRRKSIEAERRRRKDERRSRQSDF